MARVLTAADVGKEFPTREGGKALVLCDGLGDNSLFGLKIFRPNTGIYIVGTCRPNGKNTISGDGADLIIPQPEPFKREMWMNIYEHGDVAFFSQRPLPYVDGFGARRPIATKRVLVTELPDADQ